VKTIIMSALALVAGACIASHVVYGQTTPPANRQPQQTSHQRPLPGERIDARLAYLHTLLKITPAQEPQWSTLAAVLRRQAQARDADIQRRRSDRAAQQQAQTPVPRPSVIDRLQRRQQVMSNAAVRMNEILAAAKPLYASFSDDQKKIADDFFVRRNHRRGGWR